MRPQSVKHVPPRNTYSRKSNPNLKRGLFFEEDSTSATFDTFTSANHVEPPLKRRILKYKGTISRSLSDKILPRRAGNSSVQQISPQKKLTQLTLDLGQQLQTTCTHCGMSYHASDTSDTTLHATFHDNYLGGVNHPSRPTHALWERHSISEEAYIYVVDRRSLGPEKRKARDVLAVVNRELSATEIPDNILWNENKYRIYLYVVGSKKRKYKVVGLLLAEHIKHAYRVHLGGIKDSSCVSVGTVSQNAVMGISRIWACASHRRLGIASTMLDVAMRTFVYGYALDKNVIAFSQPTESGSYLAKAWCEPQSKLATTSEELQFEGWMVYKQD